MRVHERRWWVLLSLVVMLGCTSVYPRQPAGHGTYFYVAGTLSWTYPVPVPEAWEATLQVLEELTLQAHSKNLDGLGGQIEATRADKTQVKIRIKPAGIRSTRIKVHVGVLGHREQSEKIHEAIRSRLKL